MTREITATKDTFRKRCRGRVRCRQCPVSDAFSPALNCAITALQPALDGYAEHTLKQRKTIYERGLF